MAQSRTLPQGALLLALLPIACGGELEEHAFDRIERLVFVPPGPCALFPETLTPVNCSSADALLVDAFELTRVEWQRAVLETSGSVSALNHLVVWNEKTPFLPATGMTRPEAQAFAAREGMRLPTAREWIRIAAGTRAQQYPWTTVSHASVANTLELGLGELAAVGTFQGGRTPSGIYDLAGNAAEWVGSTADLSAAQSDSPDAWAMGGSYLSRQRPIYESDSNAWGAVAFNTFMLDPEHRSLQVGFRLMAEAEAWLREIIPRLPHQSADLERLRRVGRRWGAPAVALLRRLQEEMRPSPGIDALLEGAEE